MFAGARRAPLLTELPRIFSPGVAIARRHCTRTGAADAAIGSIRLAAQEQFQLVQLRERLAGDALRELGILRAPFRRVQTLRAIDKILILASQLRVARHLGSELAKLTHYLAVDGLGLRGRPDFRSALWGIPRAGVADVAATIRITAASHLAALPDASELSSTLGTTTAARLVARLLAANLLTTGLLTTLTTSGLLSLSRLLAALLIARLLAARLVAGLLAWLLATCLLSALPTLTWLTTRLAAARASLLPSRQRLHLLAHILNLVDGFLSLLARVPALASRRCRLLRALQVVPELVQPLRDRRFAHHRVLPHALPDQLLVLLHALVDFVLLGAAGGVA